MTRSVRDLLIIEAVLALSLVLIGSAADWTASDYTAALLVISVVALLTTGATIGRSGTASTGGAMTDPIGRGSVSGTPAAMVGIEIAVDDDPSMEPDLPAGPALARRPVPFVSAGVAVASGVAALVSWLFFE